MAQTTTAIGGTTCLIEVLTTPPATWTSMSGSMGKVSGATQNRAKGVGYTFEGDTGVIKRGKREPVEVAFQALYTETALEAFAVIQASFETDGGADISIRWTPEDGSNANTITDGFVSQLAYPNADASDANPVPFEFSVYGVAIVNA